MCVYEYKCLYVTFIPAGNVCTMDGCMIGMMAPHGSMFIGGPVTSEKMPYIPLEILETARYSVAGEGPPVRL